MTAGEWSVRVDLAAVYRLCDRLGLNEGVCNHLSALVPGHHDRFLVNRYGLGWDEVMSAGHEVIPRRKRLRNGRSQLAQRDGCPRCFGR